MSALIGAAGDLVLGQFTGALHKAVGARFDPNFKSWEYNGWFNKPYMLPGPEQLLAAAREERDPGRRGELTDLLRAHGIALTDYDDPPADALIVRHAPRAWQSVIQATRATPSVHECLVLRNRLQIDDDKLNHYLRHWGFQQALDEKLQASLRHDVPGPSDLVRFAVRHVFEPDLLAKFRFNDERNPILDFYHQTAGLNYRIFTGPLSETIARLYDEDVDVRHAATDLAERIGKVAPAKGAQVPEWLDQIYIDFGLPRPTWAMAFWWSHWIWPSQTQGAEMLFRFRPDRRRDDEPEDTRDLNFSRNDLNLLLRGNDYPPYFRPFMAGIARRLPGIRFMTRAIASKVFDRPRIVELFEKQGYGRPDAEAMSEALFFADRTSRYKTLRSSTRGQVLDAYRVGAIGRNAAAVALYRLTLSDPRQLAAWDFLQPNRRLDLALSRAREVRVRGLDIGGGADITLEPVGDIVAELRLVDADWRSRLLKRAIASARKCYLAGRKDLGGVAADLIRLGVDDDRRREYLDLWELERDCTSRELTTGKVQSMLRDGILTRVEAERRLVNLRWPPAEAALLVTEAARDIALDTARAAQARARTLEQQQRAAVQVVRASQAALQRARAELARHGSPAQLRTWIARDLIGPAEVRRRLLLLGWPIEDADRLIAQGLQDRAQRRERLAQRAQQQPRQPQQAEEERP